jgi:hypothetical protein
MGMPFLFARPKYVCTKFIDGVEVQVPCTEKEICSANQEQSSLQMTRNNLAQEFNLNCEKQALLGILGSIFFVGITKTIALLKKLLNFFNPFKILRLDLLVIFIKDLHYLV